ncbi:MAG: outer membrane protein assembly factor BamE [Gammaproteobacteria bacterium]|nr:outer membrane protein assembly factor BamE [Gammaproteobacteria bacterium]MDA7969678.1 outer membrane protein assembly factor BamE [Gammaproteobacteria bacterium]MDA8023897.1 outer membrane protein assembly factor BamE [Gammaproteobacteria bacterium]
MNRKTFLKIAAQTATMGAATFAAPGCILYRIDIQQGNEITLQMLDRLQLGMSRTEVTKALGFPLVTDPFNTDRWDYYFYRKRGEDGAVQQHFATLYFNEDKLARVESSLFPEQ